MSRWSRIIAVALLVTGCSEQTNFNQLFVNEKQKEAVDHLLERAQYHFDQGEFSKAKDFAQKAYDINDKNEDAAVLLGFIHLGLAGTDPFGLMKKMMEQSDNKTTLAEESTATSTLSEFADVIGFTEAERLALADEDNTVEVDGEIISGDSETEVFKNYPVIIPKTAVDARASTSNIITNVNAAIAIICPFISRSAKVLEDDTHAADDPRHTASVCTPSEFPQRQAAKSHFLWALAHLTEAVAFNSLMNETLEGLNKRGEAVEETSGNNINAQDYVNALIEIALLINVILPTDPDDAAVSMLNGIFNDLDAVSLGFATIAGIPESVTKSLMEATAKLRSSSEKVSQTGKDKNATALKDQMVGKLASKMRDEMKKREDQFTAQQKTDACKSYKSITTEPFEMCP